MKRKPKFLIALLSAALTFGTLMATIGPRHFMKHHPENCHQTTSTVK